MESVRWLGDWLPCAGRHGGRPRRPHQGRLERSRRRERSRLRAPAGPGRRECGRCAAPRSRLPCPAGRREPSSTPGGELEWDEGTESGRSTRARLSGGNGRVAQATESTSRSSKADGARWAESAACHAMLRLPRALPFFLVHTRHPPRPPWHVQTLSESLGSTALTLWQQRPIMLSGHERALTRQSSLRLSHLHRGTRHPRQLWGVVRSLLELV